MKRIFISTVPFEGPALNLLDQSGLEYTVNPTGRKLSASDVGALSMGYDGLIAGTEDIKTVLVLSKCLKIISRVGVGLDNVPLDLCVDLGIKVTTTPEAVTDAVAEYTVGLMLAGLRNIIPAFAKMNAGIWDKNVGKQLSECCVGIVGYGRIGKAVGNLLIMFGCKVQFYDIDKQDHPQQVGWQKLLRTSDVITLHVPLNQRTKQMISYSEMKLMKEGCLIINTSRGGIVNESSLNPK